MISKTILTLALKALPCRRYSVKMGKRCRFPLSLSLSARRERNESDVACFLPNFDLCCNCIARLDGMESRPRRDQRNVEPFWQTITGRGRNGGRRPRPSQGGGMRGVCLMARKRHVPRHHNFTLLTTKAKAGKSGIRWTTVTKKTEGIIVK